jgi:Ulp1 family protease
MSQDSLKTIRIIRPKQGGDEHEPKPKRRKTATDSSAPDHPQLPFTSITQKTSEDQKKRVEQYFSQQYCSRSDDISKDFRLKSFKTLQPGGWVGDEVINMFLDVLDERDARMHQGMVGQKRSFFLNSHFLQKFHDEGRAFVVRRVKRMGKRGITSMFECDKVYVPLHISKNHWALVMVSIQEKKMEYHDSLGSNKSKTGFEHMCTVREYLRQHYEEETKGILTHNWTMKIAEVPKQNNGKVQGAGVQIASCILQVLEVNSNFSPLLCRL